MGLIILSASYSYIDLRCGNLPQTSEKDVILLAESYDYCTNWITIYK